MNGLRKLEIMLEELEDNFNNHLTKSKSTYYYIMKPDGAKKSLTLNVYSRGGETECEILILPEYSSQSAPKCQVKTNGELSFTAQNVANVFPLPLKSGYHVLEFISEGVAAGLRIRLTGARSDCKEAATKK